MMRRTIGYTSGLFDLFNVRDLDVLQQAKSACDSLVVGVWTDELAQRVNGAPPYVPFDARTEILKGVRLVDSVIRVDALDPVEAWRLVGFDTVFVPSPGGVPTAEEVGSLLVGTEVAVVELTGVLDSTSPILRSALGHDDSRKSVA